MIGINSSFVVPSTPSYFFLLLQAVFVKERGLPADKPSIWKAAGVYVAELSPENSVVRTKVIKN